MTATGKVSPRLRVSYFSQKDKLTPIVFSKTFISSLILADLGPECFFFFFAEPFLPASPHFASASLCSWEKAKQWQI